MPARGGWKRGKGAARGDERRKGGRDMERRKYRGRAALALSLLIAALCAGTAAASSKTVGEVTIRIKNRAEAGDELRRGDLVEGEPESGEIGIWVNSDRCELESARLVGGSFRELSVAQEISVKLVLAIQDDEYRFKRGMGKDDVKLRGSAAEVTGVVRSAKRLTVTLRLGGVRGDYGEPESAEWSGQSRGRALWEAPQQGGSGRYELILNRGGSVIKRVYDVSGDSYNFYPYMTQAGNYRFRVRTVAPAEARELGRSSKWIESESLRIGADQLSDGAGAVWDLPSSGGEGPRNGRAGWQMQDGVWYYRFPDGSLKSSGWEKILDKWYYFDSQGRMQTGWLRTDSGWYYLGFSGEMLTGWQNINERWYYLKEDREAADYGAMAENRFVRRDGAICFVDAGGVRAAGWTEIGGNWHYFYPGNGAMARDAFVDTFYVDGDGIWVR